MGPVQATKTCLRKTAQFLGRTSRAEFWWFALLWLPLSGAVWFLIRPSNFDQIYIFGAFLVQVVICLPLLSAGARRCIDGGVNSIWIGNGFSGLLFAQGLIDIQRTGLTENPTASMTPVAIVLSIVSAITLAYVLTRPSLPGPNPLEVTP